MTKYFELEDRTLVNIIEHTRQQLLEYNSLKVYIGTDSQDYGKNKIKISRFATAIVYRYGNRGAHYVFCLEDVPKIRVMYNRLFEEAVRTIATADLITAEIPIAFEALEFDYNHIKKFKSHPLIANVKGWVTGLNYTPVFKSGNMWACKAADHICRNKQPREIE
jgi:predicted RNase H-related nuclease YkuK (DUF458 family)